MATLISSVGAIFLEDVLRLILNNTVKFGRCIFYVTRKTNNHGPSVVRKIGNKCFWIKAQRIYLLWKESDCEECSLDDENNDFNLCCHCSEHSDGGKYKNLEDKVEEMQQEMGQMRQRKEEMQKEVEELRNKVIKLLTMSQETKHFSTNSSPLQRNNVSSSSSFIAPPPPPPPPPPPTFFHPKQTILVKVTKLAHTPAAKDSTSCIMEELSKRPPKLRHVDRSPGGTPVKSTITRTDHASEILSRILKKRFEAFHSPPRDCRLGSPPISPGSPLSF